MVVLELLTGAPRLDPKSLAFGAGLAVGRSCGPRPAVEKPNKPGEFLGPNGGRQPFRKFFPLQIQTLNISLSSVDPWMFQTGSTVTPLSQWFNHNMKIHETHLIIWDA